jgi:hypothetical protein
MNMRLIATAATALFLLGSAAIAATTPTAGTCASLEKQWDAAAKEHATAPKITEATKMYEEAANLCKANNFKDGVAKYEDAFKLIGVTPKM